MNVVLIKDASPIVHIFMINKNKYYIHINKKKKESEYYFTKQTLFPKKTCNV